MLINLESLLRLKFVQFLLEPASLNENEIMQVPKTCSKKLHARLELLRFSFEYRVVHLVASKITQPRAQVCVRDISPWWETQRINLLSVARFQRYVFGNSIFVLVAQIFLCIIGHTKLFASPSDVTPAVRVHPLRSRRERKRVNALESLF